MSILELASPDQKIRYGRECLARFNNLAIKPDWFGSKWPYNFDTLLLEINKRDINEDRLQSFLETVGQAAQMSGLGMRRMDEAMERVLNKTSLSPLKIPSAQEFVKGITDELSSFDWSMLGDASLDLAAAVTEPIQNVVSGAADSVSFLGKNLKWIIIAVIGLVLFAGWKIAGKSPEILSKKINGV